MADMAPLPKDDPRMVAWEAYKRTEEYRNAMDWLKGARSPTNGEGELWAVFLAGWEARTPSPEREADTGVVDAIAAAVVLTLAESTETDIEALGAHRVAGTDAAECFVVEDRTVERAVRLVLANALHDGLLRTPSPPAPDPGTKLKELTALEDSWLRVAHDVLGTLYEEWSRIAAFDLDPILTKRPTKTIQALAGLAHVAERRRVLLAGSSPPAPEGEAVRVPPAVLHDMLGWRERNTIDGGDDPSGGEGGYDAHGNRIPRDAMREIVALRAIVDSLSARLRSSPWVAFHERLRASDAERDVVAIAAHVLASLPDAAWDEAWSVAFEDPCDLTRSQVVGGLSRAAARLRSSPAPVNEVAIDGQADSSPVSPAPPGLLTRAADALHALRHGEDVDSEPIETALRRSSPAPAEPGEGA